MALQMYNNLVALACLPGPIFLPLSLPSFLLSFLPSLPPSLHFAGRISSFPWGKQGDLSWNKPSTYRVLPSLKPFTAIWLAEKGCLSLTQVSAKCIMGTAMGGWGDANYKACGACFSHRGMLQI